MYTAAAGGALDYEQPYCIEDNGWTLLHYWDFAYFEWYNFDEGPKYWSTPDPNVNDVF